MPRTDLSDLPAFLRVARGRSFTRAAAKLGVSQAALSQTVRGFEERLGLWLLTRTSRSLAPTEAGERMLRTLARRWTTLTPRWLGSVTCTSIRPAPVASPRSSARRAQSYGLPRTGSCRATPTSRSRPPSTTG
ncbi:LysR family transcriptional regulator [Belnapia arida]|nr:LysR family transcriptional regulator [Belnapia arida]